MAANFTWHDCRMLELQMKVRFERGQMHNDLEASVGVVIVSARSDRCVSGSVRSGGSGCGSS
jgi:hypothetical protein